MISFEALFLGSCFLFSCVEMQDKPNDLAVREKPENVLSQCASPQLPHLKVLGRDGDRLVLSPAQASMWAATIRNPDQGPNVIQIVIHFTASLDAVSLQQAWQATVNLNDVLRVKITHDLDGIPSACLDSNAPDAWIDVAGPFEEKVLEADRARPFDEDTPPTRCRYWPEPGVFLWTLHHALLDGRSISQIVDDFLKHIDGDKPPHSKRHYGSLQPRDGDLELTHDVWSTLPQPAEQKRRPSLHGASDAAPSSRHCTRILFARAAVKSIEKAAAAAGTTTHGLVQWAWAFTVGRIFARRTVVLGVVRSGHWLNKDKASGGYLMNALPVVAQTDPECTLEDALQGYRKCILKIRDRVDADPRLAAANLGRSPGDPWDALVMCEHATLEELCLQDAPEGLVANLEIHELASEPLAAGVWLGKQPILEVDSDAREFSEEATALLANTWLRALELIARLPLATPLAQIEPLPVEVLEREHAFENGGAPLAPPNDTIWSAFSRVVATQPEAPALLAGGERNLTYEDLNQEAETLAAALFAAGVRSGDCVASRIDDRSYAATSLLACARLGAIYMPFDKDLPPERVQRMTSLAKPVAIIRDSNPDPFETAFIQIDPRATGTAKVELPAFEAHDPFAPFCLLFTSGSTGEPKGVLNHHHGILNEALAIIDQLKVGPNDRLLQFASLGFDTSLEEILTCLLAGATLVPRNKEILGGFDRYHRFIEHHQITIADLPTAFWSSWSAWLAQRKVIPPEPLRVVIIGGEKATASSTNAWLDSARGRIPVYNTYGPTEASIVATSGRLRIPRGGGDPDIGRPLPGLAARLMDAQGRPAAPGCVGEIMFAGCGVGLGYLNNPEATAKAFFNSPETGRPAWYRTGDLARRDSEGTLHYLTRIDDQLKIRGQRIEPGEVRAALESHPGVREAYVAARTILDHQTLVAWVVAPELNQSEMKAHLRKDLPPWMVPSHFILLESIPLNARGKVDRINLPDPELSAPSGKQSDDPLEKWMMSVFAEVLRVNPESIDPKKDFAAQGGDSLSAMTLVSRLIQAGIDFEPGELVTDSSPHLLAKRIDANYGKARTKWDPILRLRSGDSNQTPLVLIHATPGDVLGYANLIAEFPQDLPCLGVVSRSLHLPDNPHTTIEEMAQAYIEALRPHLEGKRWVLGGWCYGGILAWEMARQLAARGEEPPVILMVEAWAYSPSNKAARRKLKLAKLRALVLGSSARRKAWRANRRKRANTHEPGPAEGEWARSNAYQSNMKAVNNYHPGEYRGEVHIFVTKDPCAPVLPIRNAGWHALGARCREYAHDGSHEKVLHPPHVETLANTLVQVMRENL